VRAAVTQQPRAQVTAVAVHQSNAMWRGGEATASGSGSRNYSNRDLSFWS
jgi:hypothetical protein